MASKNNIRFPQSCKGCKHLYNHWDGVKLYSGGVMKSFGNSYCVGAKKHKKLAKGNTNYLRPSDCPIREEYPITYDVE